MGVFARLLGRSKAAEEASTAEVPAATRTAGSESAAEPAQDVEGPSASEGPSVSEGEADTGDVSAVVATEPTGVSGAAPSEDVEIPQQQTAEKAADNGAGEGARK